MHVIARTRTPDSRVRHMCRKLKSRWLMDRQIYRRSTRQLSSKPIALSRQRPRRPHSYCLPELKKQPKLEAHHPTQWKILLVSTVENGVVSHAFNLTKVGIPKSYPLLGIHSTIHAIYNQSLLTNICTGTVTMAVHCNAGTTHTDRVGDLYGFTQNITWYQPFGIANFLPLALLLNNYRIQNHAGDDGRVQRF